jgi:effector-binding domain-containing protein
MAAFEELQGALVATDVSRTGPNGALYPSELFEEELGEVTAFIPVAEPHEEPGTELPGRVHAAEIPGAEYALSVHEGAFVNLDQTYGALGTYVADREIGLRGTIRENYVVTFEQTDDESAHRTEVCWPVFHTKGDA